MSNVTSNLSQKDIAETIARNRSLIPVSFAAIVVFFFFSFVDFKCNGTTAESLTGYNLVFGTRLHNPVNSALNQSQNIFDQLDDRYNDNTDQKLAQNGDKVNPNLWAIVALIAAIAGVAVFWKRKSGEALLGTALGIAGFVSLIVLRSVIKSKVEEQAGGGVLQIETDFQFGYWISLLAFATAGAISYLRIRYRGVANTKTDEGNISKLNVFISSVPTDVKKDS